MLQVISSGMVQRLKCELENSAFQAGKHFKMYAYDTIKKIFDDFCSRVNTGCAVKSP